MKNDGIDRRTFLKSAVAGTPVAAMAIRMPYPGLPDARDRADLIACRRQAFK